MVTAPNPPRDLGPGEQLSMDQWGWKIPLRSSKPALPGSPLNHKRHIHEHLKASRDEDSHFQCDPTWWRFLSHLRVIFQSDKTRLVDFAHTWVRWWGFRISVLEESLACPGKWELHQQICFKWALSLYGGYCCILQRMKHLRTSKIEKCGFLHELSYLVYRLKKPNQLTTAGPHCFQLSCDVRCYSWSRAANASEACEVVCFNSTQRETKQRLPSKMPPSAELAAPRCLLEMFNYSLQIPKRFSSNYLISGKTYVLSSFPARINADGSFHQL